ncbi:MAG: hypothetical protein IKW83_07010 [Muribaculaceae bacterium]|nr:hypothetical protein [Muribaculaceae bacterium]
MIQIKRNILLTTKLLLIAILVASCATSTKTSKDKDKDKKKNYPSYLHEIQGLVIEEHEADWYREQYEGWLEQAEKNPKDEYAWRNCFRAKDYEIRYSNNYNYNYANSVKRGLLEKMGKSIPDTYTYYICASQVFQNDQQGGITYAHKAYELIPKNKSLFDYDHWFYFLKTYGDKNDFSNFAKDYYDSGLYSEELLQFNLNELNCMENDGIFVGEGDASVGPKWLLQEGKGIHRDKLVICYSYMAIPEYCQSIYKELGIGDAPVLPEPKGYEDYERNRQYLINDIVVKSGRKLYFSKYNPDYCYTFWNNRGSLYDIGLIYQDSPDGPIDIYKEQERFFNSTDFSYLDKPLKKDAWAADCRSSSYMPSCFWQLMLKYKEDGDTANYQKIHKMMEKAVNRIPDKKIREMGQKYLDFNDHPYASQ